MKNILVQIVTLLLVLPFSHSLQVSPFLILGRVLTSTRSKTASTSSARVSQAVFRLNASTGVNNDDSPCPPVKRDNKAMAFLKKVGRVGGKVDFTNAVGVDEGTGITKVFSSAGNFDHALSIKKSRQDYISCTNSGTIDNMSKAFPITSSGTQWTTVTDGIMGGSSSGFLVRKEFQGRISNVLTANVRLQNDDGFIQMVSDLSLDHFGLDTVDASKYDGVELHVYYVGDVQKETFDVHLKDCNCIQQTMSYRASFELLQGQWTRVRLPWSRFERFGFGEEKISLDNSTLRQIGLVATRREMNMSLALSLIGFINEK